MSTTTTTGGSQRKLVISTSKTVWWIHQSDSSLSWLQWYLVPRPTMIPLNSHPKSTLHIEHFIIVTEDGKVVGSWGPWWSGSYQLRPLSRCGYHTAMVKWMHSDDNAIKTKYHSTPSLHLSNPIKQAWVDWEGNKYPPQKILSVGG